jgi:broad specificity phosphatase PhoE
MATFELFVHLDAVGRQGWQGDQDARPLTELGQQQAEKIADELLAAGPVDGVWASNNTRSRQSVEPLAKRAGKEVKDVMGFQPPTPRGSDGEPDALTAAQQAGMIYADLMRIQQTAPNGRHVICSNGGDIINAIMAFYAGAGGQALPERLEVNLGGGPGDIRRGNVYTLKLDGQNATLSLRPASADFPQTPR